jgi:hypothetical protein
MPMFNNLMDLEFFVGTSVDLGCVALLRILHTSPCLKTLQFVTVTSHGIQCLPLIVDLLSSKMFNL